MSVVIRSTAIALAMSAAWPVMAETTNPALPAVTVTANGIPTTDADATYASEVHDRAAIDASGATTLYDYLAQYTSLNVMPSFGNKATPMIDMRGYGNNGYQNIAFSINGQRLNNIDQQGPLIGGIPLDSVESIEISKGSGSVVFGDGAMAGTVQIRTRAYNGVKASAMVGNYGIQSLGAAAGLSKELIDLSVSTENAQTGGTSNADASGHRDHSTTRNEQAHLALKPMSDLKLFLDANQSYLDFRYPNALTWAKFSADPSQRGGTNYTHQVMEARRWNTGLEYRINPRVSIALNHGAEDKDVTFVGSPTSAYDYGWSDMSGRYRGDALDVTIGAQVGDGFRRSYNWDISRTVNFSKDSRAVYVQTAYRFGATTVSAGARRESVDYNYVPGGTGSNQHQNNELNAWDIGVNHRFNNQWSVFSNLNSAYQAPDVDRAFDSNGAFLGFIRPARVKTLNVGANLDTKGNRLRTSAFYSHLSNEIYYQATGAFTGFNSNIDKSHKYGLEVRDDWRVSDSVSANAGYTYTRAIIDNAVQGNGAYDGKTLPGVPKHGVTLGLGWQPWQGGKLNLQQVWHSTSYSANDLSNTANQRQQGYKMTNVGLQQRWNKIEAFAIVENLFKNKNGLWNKDDTIYPIDFSRIYKVGLRFEL